VGQGERGEGRLGHKTGEKGYIVGGNGLARNRGAEETRKGEAGYRRFRLPRGGGEKGT